LPGGIAFTVAGDSTAGSSGDNAPAQSARVNRPRGLAFDREGNLYIADSLNHRVRRVAANGFITTVAGSGVRGYYGDGGNALYAQLNQPSGVFVDPMGTLYIADSGNHVIREVSPSGIISTIAGSGSRGSGGDHGRAQLASFYSPSAVAADADGNLFIADTFNHRIRRVSSSGIVTTIAGDGAPGFTGDGGAATAARFRSPAGLAIDSSGRIYVADLDNQRIRVLTPVAAPIPEPPAPVVADLIVKNAASFRSGPVAPGELVSIFSDAIGGAASVVRIDGRVPSASAIVPGQANSQIPVDVAGRDEIVVEIVEAGTVRAFGRVPVAPSAPGLFTMERGVGQAIAVHEDGTLNSATNPAPRGSIVVMYATGHGELDASQNVKLPVMVKVGNSYAEVLYAGAAPGFSGLMQLNLRLPGIFTAPGTLPITLTIGGVLSQPGVTVTVR
jgi:uncharacterized protein (TIGR03437 family)